MVDMTLEKITGAENVIWDLSVFYAGVDDPAIQRDMVFIVERNADTHMAQQREHRADVFEMRHIAKAQRLLAQQAGGQDR